MAATRTKAPTRPTDDTDITAVGPREPCPCGSKKRYKMCHGRAARSNAIVARPFEGLPGECDWVAMRELVPAATADLTLTGEHAGSSVKVVTVLPMVWPALHRADEQILVALQVHAGSGDPSRDAAHALLTALETDAGLPVADPGPPGAGPRLQDIVDLSASFTPTVFQGYDFWVADDADRTPESEAALEQANENVLPTERLTGVDAAYWCDAGNRCHLRWVMPHPEEKLLDAIARLHVRGESSLGEGTRFVGSFRSLGLMVPVWDLPVEATAASIEEPAADFGRRLGEAMAESTTLTSEERGARAGLVQRQVTLR